MRSRTGAGTVSDRNDELWDIADVHEPRVHTTPEDWVGIPDPVQTFGSTVERALQHLAREFAGIRAERDGLRLELEGVRVQLELVRAQLAERERFAATVRELGDIVRQLNVPPDWQTALVPNPPPPAAPPPMTVVEPVVESVVEPRVEPRVEPKRRVKRRAGRLRKWLAGVGVALAVVIVVGVLLVSVGPKVAPYHTYFVRSGSMEPTFSTGDLIVLGKVRMSEVETGDIITFERPDDPDTLVTHRVIGIETTAGGEQFRTKGDANDSADPWRVPVEGSGWRYKFRISKLGYVFGYLSTPLARLALLAVPAVLLGLVSLGDRRKRRPKGAPTSLG
jgi:signal peptidase I